MDDGFKVDPIELCRWQNRPGAPPFRLLDLGAGPHILQERVSGSWRGNEEWVNVSTAFEWGILTSWIISLDKTLNKANKCIRMSNE